MRERKNVIHCYSIADFQEEAAWLQKEHAAGWAFQNVTLGFIYHFEKCEPADMVYRLEYNEKDPNNLADYIQMVKDYGWEYLGKHCGWLYVRKPASAGSAENEEELFSDNASRLEMLRKVMKNRYFPLCLVFLCCVIPNIFRAADGDFGPVLTVFWCTMLAIYVFLLLHCYRKFRKLKNELQ